MALHGCEPKIRSRSEYRTVPLTPINPGQVAVSLEPCFFSCLFKKDKEKKNL
jgi:hypothetical protein